MPSVIQVIHAFENHSHEVCVSVDEQHFHEQELDCSLADYQFEVFSYTVNSNYKVIPQPFYKKSYNSLPQIIAVVHLHKKASRGPPYFTV